jgi:hypothetical protein
MRSRSDGRARRTLLLSQLLDLHLTRSIDRLRGTADMSKFLQLADDIEADLKAMDADAEELNAKRLKNKELSRQIFNGHHAAQDRVLEGLKKMEQVMKDMTGSNSSKAGTEGTVGTTTSTFPAGGERG